MTNRFRTGAEEMEKASKSGGYSGSTFFGIKDGETAYLRFLTDAQDWLTVEQHMYEPVVKQPWAGYNGNWPKNLSPICRKTKLENGETLFDECFICEHVPAQKGKKRAGSPRGWALACLREPHFDPNGVLEGCSDATREVKRQEGGKEVTKTEKAIVMVNLGYKNFFGPLRGMFKFYGTVLDRDYRISRVGAETDTDYEIIGLDPIPGFDLRDSEVAKRYENDISLEEEVEARASDEFYAKFFDTRVTYTPNETETNGSGPSVPKPDTDADPEALAALADRVKGYSTEGGTGSGEGGEQQTPAAVGGGGMKNFDS